MRLEPTQRPDHVLRVSARLITSSNILHFSADELERAVEQEQIDNPAFEVAEQRVCMFCGSRMYSQTCANCGHLAQLAPIGHVSEAIATYDSTSGFTEPQWAYQQQTFYDIDNYGFNEIDSDDAYDPLALIPTGETLTEALLQQLEALVTPDDAPIAEQLVGNLNERGYLEISTQEIATYLHISVERVEYVLGLLHTLDPLGIGARDLRECLLIQLQALSEQKAPHPLAQALIEQHLDALGKNQLHDIARAMKVSEQEVKQASQYIRSTLHPFPAHIYHAETPYTRSATGATYVRPDIIIRASENGFEVELIEERRYRFQIRTDYPDTSQAPTGATTRTAPIQVAVSPTQQQGSSEVQRYMHHYSNHAKFFVDCIHRRWHTLKQVAELVVDYQREFLEKGIRYLRPLTRAEIAQRLNLDEGTVSRATAHKYALLPNGRLIPMSDFFDGSLGIKDILRELLQAENPKHRLSDEDLARLMTARGYPMARRTVTKYREEMGIGSSRERGQ